MALDKKTARGERQAIRQYLNRKIRTTVGNGANIAYQSVLVWVLDRQARYDKKPGGL